MTKEEDGWCGYIDMLGTRALAKRSAQDLLEGLDKFHTALEDAFESFDGGTCIAFSDGAFFKAREFDSFIPFFRRVRNQLFQGGVYFRCSLIKGDIHIIERARSIKGTKKSTLPAFLSLTFAKDAPTAYQKESEFKGIGCIIGTPIEHTDIVPSFFLKNTSGKVEFLKFQDLRYSEFELSEEGGINKSSKTFPSEIRLFDKLLESCHAALAQSNSLGSYYLAALVSMLRSTDLSRLDFDKEKSEWVHAPYVFRELMNDSLVRTIRPMPGIHTLFLAFYDHLFHQQQQAIPREAELRVISKLSRIPGCFKNLDKIPDFVISQKARHRLIEARVALTRSKLVNTV